jgi:hypothetical protein
MFRENRSAAEIDCLRAGYLMDAVGLVKNLTLQGESLGSSFQS